MRAIRGALTGLYASILVALGCGASTQQAVGTAAQQADVAAYAAELQACVANADGSMSEAEACAARVRARWCPDGGQLNGFCAGQTPADGGGQ